MASSNIFHAFPSSFHTSFSCQVLLLSFRPHQEISRGHRTLPNHNVLYVVDKNIFKVINDKQNGYLEISQCELTHASSSPTTLPQKVTIAKLRWHKPLSGWDTTRTEWNQSVMTW
jgi:hypothetical protein